jgi:5-methyltetrahydrofolate--homocysteine methyltransferase
MNNEAGVGGYMARMKRGRLLFDGGMGSMLIARGLDPGAPPEGWNLTRPDEVRGIHGAYLDAGADVITTNTFGGELALINNTAVQLARQAVAECDNRCDRYVAFSVGPTGKMLPPVGNAAETEIEAEFEDQLQCLDHPVDLILGETFFDVREALAALRAVRRKTDAPVAIGLTFTKTPRGFFTVMGDAVADALSRLEAAGADFVAVNCSIASADMVELAHQLRGCTRLPVLCQPNAGQPAVLDGKPVYEQRPESFAADVVRIFDAGIEAAGGCCGTTPEFIRRARDKINVSQ